jgi:hypothetical protein
MLLSLERQWVIHWNIFAVGMFAAVAVVFVCRLLQKPKVSERPKLTKYL